MNRFDGPARCMRPLVCRSGQLGGEGTAEYGLLVGEARSRVVFGRTPSRGFPCPLHRARTPVKRGSSGKSGECAHVRRVGVVGAVEVLDG